MLAARRQTASNPLELLVVLAAAVAVAHFFSSPRHRAVQIPAPLSPSTEVPHPVVRPHPRSRSASGRAARNHRTFRNPLAPTAAGAPPGRVSAPVGRHGHVLSPSPAARAYDCRSSRGAPGTYLGRCDSAGARRDTRAAAAAESVCGTGLVAAGRAVRPLEGIDGLAYLESALCERDAVRAVDVDLGRRDSVIVALGVACGAAVPVVSAVADAGMGAVAEHVEGMWVALR